MKYQAIVLDLDGTLLNEQNQINEVNSAAVRLAVEHGYRVTLASGRPHQMMLPFAKQLNIQEPLICCNGVYQYDLQTNIKLAPKAIETHSLTLLLNLLNDGQFDFTVYAENGIFALQPSAHIKGIASQGDVLNVDLAVQIVADLASLIRQAGAVFKILVPCQDSAALIELRRDISAHFKADLSTPNKLDITAKSASKGSALKHWLKQCGIASHRAVAFGDGDNDKSMLQSVGEPVAMANASPSLKGIANLIITDNNGCGIGQYLRLIIQEGQYRSATRLVTKETL